MTAKKQSFLRHKNSSRIFMEPKIIRAEDLKLNNYGDTKVADILNTKEFSEFSIAIVKKVGDDVKLGADQESDVACFVLEGEGRCIVEGEKFILKKGDLIFLPRGTKYKNMKGLTLLAIASPRFDIKKRKYFE